MAAGSFLIDIKDLSDIESLEFGTHNDKVTTPQTIYGIDILLGDIRCVCNSAHHYQLLDLHTQL